MNHVMVNEELWGKFGLQNVDFGLNKKSLGLLHIFFCDSFAYLLSIY
jgi:hypothetical protein